MKPSRVTARLATTSLSRSKEFIPVDYLLSAKYSNGGTLSGRPQQVTDDEIFDAVAATITDHGPTGATMNRIAGRLGMTGPALGHRFGDKRSLMLAFAGRQPSAVNDVFDQQQQLHHRPLDAIVGAYTEMVSATTTKQALANNLAMLHLDLTDPDFGAHAALHAQSIKKRTAQLIAEAEPALSARSAQQRALDVYTTWNGALISWAIDGTGPLEAWIENNIRRALSATSR
jgi:AcrR family transcriptional regulator